MSTETRDAVLPREGEGVRPDPRAGRRWLVVAAGGSVFFMAMLDSSIVSVALPVIGGKLHVQPSAAQWAVVGYLLALVSLIVPSGRWLDRVGRRTALLFGTGGFALSSLACALSRDVGELVAARLVQGAFGAALFAVVPAIVAAAVPAEKRGRGMGVLAMFGPLGALCGPIAGGLLVSAFGWQSIFLVNLPISVGAMALAVAAMPAGGRLTPPGLSWLLEVVLFGGATTGVMLALTFAPSDGAVWLAPLAPAAVFLWLWTRLPTSGRVVSAVRGRALAPLLGMRFLMLTAVAVAPFLVPFFLQGQLHKSSTTVGLTLLPMTAAMVVVGPFGGGLADRYGMRRVSTAGSIVALAALLSLTPLGTGWSPVQVGWRLAVLGLGLALFSGPNQAECLSAVKQELSGVASATSGLAQNLGFAFGPAVAAAAWALNGYRLSGMRVAFVAAAACAGLALAIALVSARPRRRTA